MPANIETEANALYAQLIAGESFTIPTVDVTGSSFDIPGGATNQALMAPIARLNMNMVTNASMDSGGVINYGTGAMDSLMKSFSAHLLSEFERGRIVGADYTKAYIAMTETAAQVGLQFVINSEQAYWASLTAQMGVIASRINLAIAKTQLANGYIEAHTAKVNFALTKAKIATEKAGYISVSEQGEAQRAQTLDTRSDGATVGGAMGTQKNLYLQQIDSYKRDAEVKAGKMWTDAWITMKTIDEGLLPPSQFTNANLDVVLNKIKTNNNLG